MTNLTTLKQQYNIVDIVSKRVELKHRGSEYVGLCPFHDDTKHSLNVNPQKQIFKCFACGAGGDIFDWFKQLGADYRVELGIQQQPKPKRTNPTHTSTWTYLS